MTISSTSLMSPTTSTPTSSTGANAGAASRDQFLRLFVAQLENQNPLDPQSGADMVAQLAQFSSVEQAVETNKRLADLVAAQDAAGSAGLTNLVGREVTADASILTLDGAPPPIQLASDKAIAAGEVVIKNAEGQEVRRISVGPGTSPQALAWDGKDAHGVALPPGSYSIEVTATSADGAPLTVRPQVRGVVDALELTANGPRLHVGGGIVSPADVTTIARTGA
jgi:flagellar basal-body rod modification protein FlgD